MKNRIIRVLLLLSATALVSIPSVASNRGHEDIIETDVAAQDNTTTITKEENIIIPRKEWFEAWTTNVVNVRQEPFEDSKILKVFEECTYIYGYQYDTEWVAIIYQEENNFVRLSKHADSALVFAVKAWTKTENYWDVYFDLMEDIKKVLDKNKIEIPFPQMDVHINK